MIASALFAATLSSATPAPRINVDVVISAGHEGRPESCARFPARACNLGARGERAWTPIVADEATRMLRLHGVSVARLPADFDGNYAAGAAIFIHFDGSEKPCSTGASIGYRSAKDKPAADAWRGLYSRYIPFGFMPDNFTEGLHGYYGFRQVDARNGALVLELGELTCSRGRAWLEPRLKWEGSLIAYFVSVLIGKGNIPVPGAFVR